MSGAEENGRRAEREIGIFERHEALHGHNAAFHFCNVRCGGAAAAAAFGRLRLDEILATVLAGGVARSGKDTVFSLGCGDGVQEQGILRAADGLGLPRFNIIGLELAPAVARRANALAAQAGMADRLSVRVHDLNTGLPGEAPAGGVLAFQSLHHVSELERLLGSVAQRLHPDGAFAVSDIIGRNGHMRWPEVRPLVRKIHAALPAEKRFDHVFGRPQPFFQDWDCAIEGFEGVRAQDILGLLAEHFEVSCFAAWGGVAEPFVNGRMGPNFDPADPVDRAFLARLAALEVKLLAERRTTPCVMVAEYRSRGGGFKAPAEAAAAQREALRLPDEVFAPLDSEPFMSPYPPQPAAPAPLLSPDIEHIPATGADLLEALQGGWDVSDPNHAWAILDEQFLRFRTEPPTDMVDISVWTNVADHRAVEISAEAEGCVPGRSGAMTEARLAVLTLTAPAPRGAWDVRLTSSAYRLPDLDPGDDLRPLAYLLISLRARATPPPPPEKLPSWKRWVRRARRR